MNIIEYKDFLERKSHSANKFGFEPVFMPDFLFDFQKSLVEWSLRLGRGALFEDCGLGKTPQYLTWAQNIIQKTNKRVLVLTPLAVSYQTVKEGEKFGIDCEQSRDGKFKGKLVITNYERLHYFDSNDFIGCVCDESSILKNFKGTRKTEITDFMKKMPYRMLCTATAAPNDYIELGTSSEALGCMGFMDMLNRFFKNDANNSAVGRKYGEMVKWRFKRHAESIFWRWVVSWARAIRKPSDIGFDDGPFKLPPLIENLHVIDCTKPLPGQLFVQEVRGLKEQRDEIRMTLKERCEKTADIVNHDRPFIAWCHLNEEGDYLEKIIPDAVQVAGKHSDDEKEKRLMQFVNGEIRGLITKPSIAGFGLNFQHCSHMTFFPSHSYEQYYQGVRRCWRFGQKNSVQVDVVSTSGMASVLRNLQKKSAAADKMFSSLVEYMNDSIQFDKMENHIKTQEVPSWL